jgi:hypothetical protein
MIVHHFCTKQNNFMEFLITARGEEFELRKKIEIPHSTHLLVLLYCYKTIMNVHVYRDVNRF